jgi:hypothetical protein
VSGAPRTAFYATGRGTGGWRDWFTVLHPPYTAWHLSYVAIGASLAHPIRFDRLGWSLLAFFLGLGIGGHALDELHGRPLRTGIRGWQLTGAALGSIAGALVIGWLVGGLHLVPFMVVGAFLVFGYNLEWFNGVVHNAVGFGLAWGAFPLVTGYYAQHWSVSAAAGVAAVGAFALTLAQRALSTPARWLRRTALEFHADVSLRDGSRIELATSDVLRPLERALKAISWAVVTLALGLVVAAR